MASTGRACSACPAGAPAAKRARGRATGARAARPTAAAASAPEFSATAQKVQDVLEKDPLSEQISALQQEQETLRRQRKELSKTLKLAERKKTRLRKRAKAMTNEDLIQVLMMRKEQRECAAAEAAGERHTAAETDAGGEEGEE